MQHHASLSCRDTTFRMINEPLEYMTNRYEYNPFRYIIIGLHTVISMNLVPFTSPVCFVDVQFNS